MIIGASCPCRFRLTRSTSSTLVHNLSKCQRQRFLNLRSSHSTSIGTKEGPTLKDDGWEFWGKKDNEAGKAIQADGKNIFVGDLEATLKAHRAANRAKRIRYFPGDLQRQEVGFYRLNTSQFGQDDTSPAKGHKASRQDKDIKSKGSTPGKNALKPGKRKAGREKNVSNIAKEGSNPDKNALKLEKNLSNSAREGSNPQKRKANKVRGDYKGNNVDPQNLWARNVIEPNRTSESPWLKYLKPGGGTALTRYAWVFMSSARFLITC